MEPLVLIVGSLHLDIVVEAGALPQRDETCVGTRWYPKCGGKGGNQALAVRRAGVACRMLGAVGADDFGTRLREGLAAAGVDHAFVASLASHATGMSAAILDPAGDYAAAIVSGANLAIDPAALEDDALWRSVRVLVLQNEVTPALNLAAARAARMRGLPVVLNAAPARALDPALAAATDVLVVNRVEAEAMGTGRVDTLDAAAAAADLLGRAWPSVIVTAGGAGLALRMSGRTTRIPATPVRVVSTHGAGDAFTGTLAARLARGEHLAAACAAASEAAAVHVAAASA